jgi:3-oxoacyl-[acyl-carrier-protein] synthase-1/3-oxoacyl-[acyl-carrier-protein] synthase II
MESALAIDCLLRQVLPATAGEGELDPEVGAAPREVNESGEVRAVLKLSAAFGGANAALVLSHATGSANDRLAQHDLLERATVTVDEPTDLDRVAAITGVARDKLNRMDGVCHAALYAVGTLAEQVGRDTLRGAGIVLGTVLATIDVNAIYDENLRKKGAPFAEGRRFAYTTPNAAAGECAMAFSLTGPNIAVSRGPSAYEEASEVARDLLRAGDAERVVVVEVDAGGPAARSIATATGWPVHFGARARLLERRA